MSLTIDDVKDVRVGAEAEARQFVDEFMADFFAPVGKRMVRELLRTATPMQLDYLKNLNPENMEQVMKMTGGKYNG